MTRSSGPSSSSSGTGRTLAPSRCSRASQRSQPQRSATPTTTPLSERQVQRLMAEMINVGAMKVEERWGGTGRQRSSVRILNVRLAIRFRQPVAHLWDAPLPAEPSIEGSDRPLYVTPDVTPGLSQGPGGLAPRWAAWAPPARRREYGRPLPAPTIRGHPPRARSVSTRGELVLAAHCAVLKPEDQLLLGLHAGLAVGVLDVRIDR